MTHEQRNSWRAVSKIERAMRRTLRVGDLAVIPSFSRQDDLGGVFVLFAQLVPQAYHVATGWLMVEPGKADGLSFFLFISNVVQNRNHGITNQMQTTAEGRLLCYLRPRRRCLI